MRRDETFAVGEHVVVDVELPAGSILLRSANPGTVLVSIDSPTPDSYEVVQIGDNISVRARRGRNARLVIEVPTGSDVNVKGASVEVTARGALGALRVRCASGDVSAEDVVRADVSVTSGDTHIDLVRNDATFNATSGDIVVRSIGGRVVAALASGDLRATEVSGDVEAETASGDVDIRRCGGAAITVRTLSGDIRIGLPSGIRVAPEISTMSGRVTLPDPATSRSAAEPRPVRVRLRSVSGDIRIERAK